VPIHQRNKLLGISEKLQLWHRFIDELSKTVRQLLSKDSRDQRIKQAIKEAIDVVSDAFGSYCTHNKIDIQNKVPPNLVTPPMFLAQLYSIIANLLTNSMKWVMFTDDRRIEFGGRKTSTGVKFWILDSGPGVEEDIRTKVFKPFVSYSTPNLDLGTGTGLGLTIVKNFVEDSHGTVEFLNPPDDWGTYCLMIFEDVDR
jgi:signal transduction histidine kinase